MASLSELLAKLILKFNPDAEISDTTIEGLMDELTESVVPGGESLEDVPYEIVDYYGYNCLKISADDFKDAIYYISIGGEFYSLYLNEYLISARSNVIYTMGSQGANFTLKYLSLDKDDNDLYLTYNEVYFATPNQSQRLDFPEPDIVKRIPIMST